jgi:hypothetical protein
MNLTDKFILIIITICLLYDLVILFGWVKAPLISDNVYKRSQELPFIPLLTGMLIWHLFRK